LACLWRGGRLNLAILKCRWYCGCRNSGIYRGSGVLMTTPTNDGRQTTPTPEAGPKQSISSSGWLVARRIIRTIIAVVLILLGLAALLTPLTPGSWLILVGLELLGLRVLLRDRLCAWAKAKPESRLRRTVCRVFSLGSLDAAKRKWWRRGPKPRP